MSDNMNLWNQVCETNPDNTKEVSFGRKFTAIDAYSQIQRATELFGPYGAKWGLFDITHEFIFESICLAKAVFKFPDGEFPLSSSMDIKTKKGIDQEFAKKIETDLITKALSRLGFNADVFLGKFEDNRYVQQVHEKFQINEKLNELTAKTVELLDAVDHHKMETVVDFVDFWNGLGQEMQIAVNGNNAGYPEKQASKYKGLIKSTIKQHKDIIAEYVVGIKTATESQDCAAVTELVGELKDHKVLKRTVWNQLEKRQQDFIFQCSTKEDSKAA